jgi:hypothetical protein
LGKTAAVFVHIDNLGNHGPLRGIEQSGTCLGERAFKPQSKTVLEKLD